MVKAKWIMVAMATSMLLVACKPSEVDFSCQQPTLSIPPSKSDHLTINVYLDGTPSMEGYVNTPTKSRYAQTLDLLDSTFSLSNAKVVYNRLGTNTQTISRKQFQKDTQLRTFYNGHDPQYPLLQESLIDKAVTPTDKEHQLSVIITDLYQEDNDVTKVSQEIKKNYFNAEQAKQGYALGIIALKSEFNGIVYNEDVNSTRFPYNTNGKPLHPFYAVFLGKYADIDDFFGKIVRQGGELIKDSKLVIFSPNYLIKEPLHFSSNSSETSKKKDIRKSPNSDEIDITRPFSLQYKKVVIGKGEGIEMLEIGKSQKTEIPLNYNLPLNPFPHTLLFSDKSLKTKVKIESFDTFSQRKDQTTTLLSKQLIEMSGFEINPEQTMLKFMTKLNPSQMKPTIYLFTIDTIATELQEQPWWREWNSTEANRNDGSKTFNILRFLQEIKNVTTDLMTQENTQPPTVGHFCYAIQKDS